MFRFSSSILFVKLILGFLFTAFAFSNSHSAFAQSLADIIEQSEKSLVRIEVKGLQGGSLGSGFIVSDDGLLVTNVHVLAGAEKAIAIFPSGKKFEIVGTLHIDEARDICIARIKFPNSTAIKLADALPRKGETVTALGSPMGLSFTATTGIVSGIRSSDDIGRDIDNKSMEGTWVQVDAALSGGNSGGPLINGKGEVVAMSTLASQGAAQNLNFGISIIDIRSALVEAKTATEIAFVDGVGKIESHATSDAPNAIVKRIEIPESALRKYTQEGRESYRELATKVQRSATAVEKEWRLMKKGEPYLPPGATSDAEAILSTTQRGKKKFYFRGESTKKRYVKQKEDKKNELNELKATLKESSKDQALFALLRKAGPILDPQEPKSIGFLAGATVIHAYNEHEIIVEYEGSPYLMWVESSAGLSAGEELSARPAFVSGTKTLMIPGKTTMAVTVLQTVTKRELEKVALGDPQYLSWSDKTGKYKIEAILLKNDGKMVHLKKRDGSTIQVPLSRLDKKSKEAAAGN